MPSGGSGMLMEMAASRGICAKLHIGQLSGSCGLLSIG